MHIVRGWERCVSYIVLIRVTSLLLVGEQAIRLWPRIVSEGKSFRQKVV